jgi:hypothetical protein
LTLASLASVVPTASYAVESEADRSLRADLGYDPVRRLRMR